MKWKGPTQTPKNDTRILFEVDGRLHTGTTDHRKIISQDEEYHLNFLDKWMYESEAKQILFEHSFPNVKYDED
jgi:hypothetical protein